MRRIKLSGMRKRRQTRFDGKREWAIRQTCRCHDRANPIQSRITIATDLKPPGWNPIIMSISGLSVFKVLSFVINMIKDHGTKAHIMDHVMWPWSRIGDTAIHRTHCKNKCDCDQTHISIIRLSSKRSGKFFLLCSHNPQWKHGRQTRIYKNIENRDE